MGLAVEVGIMSDLLENDDESFEYYEEQFAAINELLSERDLPTHAEPSHVDEVVSFDMWSYSGLHYLRRFAAHIDETGKPPTPGGDESSADPILQKYYAEDEKAKCKFHHLMDHSDAEGFYLPVDFPEPITAPEDSEITGGTIGSSQRLLAECEELAKHLGLPTDLDPESDAIWDAAEMQGEGGEGWQKYGVESFTCLRLIHAARASIKHGAAIVFV